jgi:prevent-host-death family protein
MTTISISDLKSALSEFLNRAAYGRERIIVTSRGKPKAVLISIEDLRRLEQLEEAFATRDAGQTAPPGKAGGTENVADKDRVR